jgi:enoyl-CoA hydratase
MTSTVQLEIDHTIAHLRIDDGKANALNATLLTDLEEALHAAEAEEKALLLEGRNGIFCAGLDLKTLPTLEADELKETLEQFARVMMRLFLYPRPVVAACRGHAIAGGCVVLLAADERFAAAGEFKIGLNETALGIALPRFVVEMARAQLPQNVLQPVVAAGELWTPGEARSLGIVQHVDPLEEVSELAKAKARRLAQLPAKSYAANKLSLREDSAAKGQAAFPAELEDFMGFFRGR